MTRLFLKHGATPCAPNGDTAIHQAAFWGKSKVAELLLEAFPEEQLASKINSSGETPLHKLARWRPDALPEMGTALLRARADVNANDAAGQTPLHTLASKSMQAAGRYQRRHYQQELPGRLNAITFLLTNGAFPQRLDEEGRSALHAACQGDSLPHEEISLLVKSGFDINLRDAEGRTPMALWLIEAGDSYRSFSEKSEALLKTFPDDARLLLSLGADPAVEDKHGKRAIDFSNASLRADLEKQYPEIVTLLDKKHPKRQTLLNLCANGCSEAVVR